MIIRVHRNETSQTFVYGGPNDPYGREVINAYTKGGMYCIMHRRPNEKSVITKYPLCTLFRVEEISD